MRPGTRRIAVVGGGLAAEAVVTALAARLGPDHAVTFVETDRAPATDAFYGTVTGPSAYAFHERIGLTEADVLTGSDAAFSWGTRYEGWGPGRSWTLAHQQPLQPLADVDLHHFLTRLGGAPLEPLIVAARAAAKGVFAHPPGPKPSPLTRAEYGYQVSPPGLADAYRAGRRAERVRHVPAEVRTVETGPDGIAGVALSTGERIEADLYVDAGGPGGALLSALRARPAPARRLRLETGLRPAARLGPPCRTVTGAPYGWSATTPTRAGAIAMRAMAPGDAAADGDADGVEADLGARPSAWIGNCVGVGHAAAVLEPLTTAPLTLLHRDVLRLLELVPVARDHAVERREYDRRHAEDARHADLFQRAFHAVPGAPKTPYWTAAAEAASHPDLDRKIRQFENRGILVMHDFEPFTREDWLTLHWGLGRVPGRHDRLTGRVPEDAVRAEFAKTRRAIEALTDAMPPHDRYVARFLDYLERER